MEFFCIHFIIDIKGSLLNTAEADAKSWVRAAMPWHVGRGEGFWALAFLTKSSGNLVEGGNQVTAKIIIQSTRQFVKSIILTTHELLINDKTGSHPVAYYSSGLPGVIMV